MVKGEVKINEAIFTVKPDYSGWEEYKEEEDKTNIDKLYQELKDQKDLDKLLGDALGKVRVNYIKHEMKKFLDKHTLEDAILIMNHKVDQVVDRGVVITNDFKTALIMLPIKVAFRLLIFFADSAGVMIRVALFMKKFGYDPLSEYMGVSVEEIHAKFKDILEVADTTSIEQPRFAKLKSFMQDVADRSKVMDELTTKFKVPRELLVSFYTTIDNLIIKKGRRVIKEFIGHIARYTASIKQGVKYVLAKGVSALMKILVGLAITIILLTSVGGIMAVMTSVIGTTILILAFAKAVGIVSHFVDKEDLPAVNIEIENEVITEGIIFEADEEDEIDAEDTEEKEEQKEEQKEEEPTDDNEEPDLEEPEETPSFLDDTGDETIDGNKKTDMMNSIDTMYERFTEEYYNFLETDLYKENADLFSDILGEYNRTLLNIEGLTNVMVNKTNNELAIAIISFKEQFIAISKEIERISNIIEENRGS